MRCIPAIVSIVVAILVLLMARDWLIPGIPYADKIFDQATKIAGSLFVIAVFMERALAVINLLIFGDASTAAQARLYKSGPSDLEANLKISDGMEINEQRLRLAVGFVFGILISAAGPRTLEALLNVASMKADAGWTNNAQSFFRIVDIVLTAGLLAGGSDALAQIVLVLKKQMVLTKYRLINSIRRERSVQAADKVIES